MKRLIVVALALCVLLSFSACLPGEDNGTVGGTKEPTGNIVTDGNGEDIGNEETDGSQADNESGNNTETDGSQNNNESDNNTENDSNKIDLSRVTNITKFAEGKAFARYGAPTTDEYKTVYCIDKSGTILFTLNDFSGSIVSGFFNDFAILMSGGVCLCTDSGEIIKPEDVGATNFLISHDQTGPMISDGYIFVEKTVTDFKGSSTKAAILNSDFEVIVDYSEELYTLYKRSGFSWYSGGGYLYYGQSSKSIDAILDLNTGKLMEDFAESAASVERRYESDLWYYENGCYYDLVTGEKKIDLTEYSETLTNVWYEFDEGFAPVRFRSAGKEFVTIINEEGAFCFDPVEIQGASPQFLRDGENLLVFFSIGREYHMETFGADGKLGEFVVTAEVGTAIAPNISDDVVFVTIFGDTETYEFYTLDFKPFLQ